MVSTVMSSSCPNARAVSAMVLAPGRRDAWQKKSIDAFKSVQLSR